MKTKLVGSAGSKEQMLALLAKYFYSVISMNDDGSVSNSSGVIEGCRWTLKKGRYRFERIES
jgi:hypothetical protein